MLPSDPMILLSYVNTHLRDDGDTLEEFCLHHDITVEELKEKLASIGYHYVSETNSFH